MEPGLNAEINKAFRSPDLVEFLDKSGYEYVAGSPEQLRQTVEKDFALWGRVIKAAGIKSE